MARQTHDKLKTPSFSNQQRYPRVVNLVWSLDKIFACQEEVTYMKKDRVWIHLHVRYIFPAS